MSFVFTAIAGVAAAGLASAYGATKAASAQKEAAQKASDTAMAQYNTTRGDLAPYRAIGTDAGNRLGSRLDELTAPINMTQAQLEQTPGWQFTNYQGQKAVQNAASARGLGVSGAALKGAANFATGLADQTYKTQFDIANTNQTNAYNRLKSLVDTGQNAAAQTGTLGANAANTSASAAMAAGNAQAAGYNAIGGAASNTANNIAGIGLYKGLYGGGNNANAGGSAGGGVG